MKKIFWQKFELNVSKKFFEASSRLQLFGFRLRKKKCFFVLLSVCYLDFILDPDDIILNLDKILTIKKVLMLSNVSAV